MGIRARPNSTAAEPEDDADTDNTIPASISHLKTAFTFADFARAERALLARESNLKREIESLKKKENAKLLEASQFHELEMLRVEAESRGVILEQRTRIGELEGLVVSEYEGWKGLVSKLEGKLSSGGKERSGGVTGVGVKLEKEEVEGDEIGGLASSYFVNVKESGFRKSVSEDAGLVSRHYECALKDTEMLCEKSEIHKDTESLGLTGVERKPRLPKRKPVSSLSGSDDDNKWGGKLKEDKNFNNEKRQRQKLSPEPDCPLINNQCTEILDLSASKVFENLNLPNYGNLKRKLWQN